MVADIMMYSFLVNAGIIHIQSNEMLEGNYCKTDIIHELGIMCGRNPGTFKSMYSTDQMQGILHSRFNCVCLQC